MGAGGTASSTNFTTPPKSVKFGRRAPHVQFLNAAVRHTRLMEKRVSNGGYAEVFRQWRQLAHH